MTTRTAAALVLLVSVSRPIAAQDADVVATKFGWPVGTSATVTMYTRNLRSGDGTDADIVIEGTYDFDVESHADGILVRHSNATLTNFTSVPEMPPDNPLRLLYSRLGGITPNYVVSSDGELLRVDGIQEMRDGMLEVLGPIMDSIPDQAAVLAGLLEQVTSSEALFAQMNDQWNLMVGFWVDAELEIDALYELDDTGPSPLVPDEMIPYLYQFAAAERVPCTEDSAALACVRFEFISVPDPDVLSDMLERFVAQLGPDAALTVDSLEQEHAVTLIADPMTMLPYRWQMSRVVDMVGTAAGEQSEAFRLDETVLEFTYR